MINNNLRVSLEERLITGPTVGSGKKVLLRLHEMSATCLVDHVYRLHLAVELGLDSCAGTLETEMASLQLPEHHTCVGWEKDFACFHDAPPLLMEVGTKQVMNADCDITGGKEVLEASKVFVKGMACFVLERRVDSRSVPPGIVPVQVLPVHVMHLLRKAYKDSTLFETCRHILPSHCSDTWQECFYSMDLDSIQAVDMSALGITVRNANLSHPDDWLGLSAFMTVRKGELVR